MSPDTRSLPGGAWRNRFGPQPATHIAAILVGAPSMKGPRWRNNAF